MVETATAREIKIKVPKLWKVIFHNDDFTPMDFVVELLKAVFNKTDEEADFLTNKVHEEGQAVIGLYTKEVAETKVIQAQKIAEDFEHPLLVTFEEDN